MKKTALILGSLLISASVLAKEVVAEPVKVEEPVVIEEQAVSEVVPEEKKWSFKTGVQHVERQQGRMNSRSYDQGIPDDLGEDGDVTTIFSTLGYKFNEKWAMDYTYKYDYVRSDEAFSKNSKGDNADKDDGQMISHTIKLTRTFSPFELAGQKWESKSYVGFRKYWESSIEDNDGDSEDGYRYNGFDSDRILAGASMNTQLTERTGLEFAYDYQYRTYDSDDKNNERENQHRHWLAMIVEHDFNDSFYVIIDNTLYLNQQVSETKNYGEWDPTYTLGHKYPLPKGYVLNTELTYWAEIPIWEAGSRELSDDTQAELVFMPKIKKTFELGEDSNIEAFVGAGYVIGFNSQTNDKQYSGFEGRTGATFNYKF